MISLQNNPQSFSSQKDASLRPTERGPPPNVFFTCWLRWLLPHGGDTGTLLVRRSACPLSYVFPFHFFTLFICTTRVAYATLAMYIGRSLRGGERSLRSFARSLVALGMLHVKILTVFRPLTRCASSTSPGAHKPSGNPSTSHGVQDPLCIHPIPIPWQTFQNDQTWMLDNPWGQAQHCYGKTGH